MAKGMAGIIAGNHKLRWEWRAMVMRLLLDIARSLWFMRHAYVKQTTTGDLAARMPFEMFSQAEKIATQYEEKAN